MLAALPPDDLVSWWRAEGDGRDFAGPNDGGVLQNGAAFAGGMVGQAFSFDGRDDRFVVPDSASLDLPRFTAEAWFRLDEDPETSKIVLAKGLTGIGSENPGNNENYTIFVFGGDNGSLARHIGAGFEEANGVNHFAVSESPVTIGKLVHVAATYDGGAVRLYVNGKLESKEATNAEPDLSVQPLVIGGEAESAGFTNRNYFPGLIDEVSLYSRALSEAEVGGLFVAGSEGKATIVVTTSADTVSGTDGVTSLREAIERSNVAPGRDVIGFDIPATPAGLISQYRAEGDANDSVGANKGTLVNGASFAAGQVGQAFSLDGVNDFVELGNDASLNPGQITVEAWWNGVEFAGNGANAIVSKGTIPHVAPFYQYHLFVAGT